MPVVGVVRPEVRDGQGLGVLLWDGSVRDLGNARGASVRHFLTRYGVYKTLILLVDIVAVQCIASPSKHCSFRLERQIDGILSPGPRTRENTTRENHVK